MNIEEGSKVGAIFPPTNITTATNSSPLRKKNRLFALKPHTTAAALRTPIIYIPRLRIRFFTVKRRQCECILFYFSKCKKFFFTFFFLLFLSYLSSRTVLVRTPEFLHPPLRSVDKFRLVM
jgi:hypothetical protein